MWSSPVTGLLRRTRGGAISQNDDRGRRLPFAARRPVIQARLGVALTFGFGGGFGRDLSVFGHRRSGFSGRRFFSSGSCFRNLSFFGYRSGRFFGQRRFGDGLDSRAKVFAAGRTGDRKSTRLNSSH